MDDIDRLFEEAVENIEEGRPAEGRLLLRQVLERQPDHVDALLWLSKVAWTISYKRECLEEVLSIDPGNPYATQELQKLPLSVQSPQVTQTQAGRSTDDPPIESVASSESSCPKCGADNADDQKFCGQCGASLSTEESATGRKSRIVWGWITLVAGIAIALIFGQVEGINILGLILQMVALVLGIVLWRSHNLAEKKHGKVITVIWLVFQSFGCCIGFIIGAGGF